jgi:hypothetical protein
MRRTNFEPTATTAASPAMASVSVRSSRQSDSDEMSALLRPDATRPDGACPDGACPASACSATVWAATAKPIVTSAWVTVMSKPRRAMP